MTMRVCHMLGGLLRRSAAEGQPSAMSLAEVEPIPLPGPWWHGIALGMHAEDSEGTERSAIGALLVEFKYAGHRALARPLGEALARAVAPWRPEVVVHVPSTRRSSFEPACELSRATARSLRVRCLPHFIARTRTIIP